MKAITLSFLLASGGGLAALAGTQPAAPKPATIPVPAAAKVDVNALLKEVMKFDLASQSDHMSVAFWAPFEFFQAVGRASAKPEQYAELDKSIEVLKNYQIFLVRRSYKDDQGLSRVIAAEDLARTAVLILRDGTERLPLRELPNEIAGTVSAFKRGVEANSQGIEYSTLVFSNKGKAGQWLLSAASKDRVSLRFKAISPMAESRFTWSTPLDSLSAPQACPTCRESLPQSWSFCPWDGARLGGGAK
ncbi:MAG: hypothetical protein H6P99_624 [Holophagaceae bacterium]|nr:hypothetical protein [Holophagaceae bacterium]